MSSRELRDTPASYCRRCGAEIAWRETEEGTRLPLDRHYVEKREAQRGGLGLYTPTKEKRGVVVGPLSPRFAPRGGYACHFATCTERRQDERWLHDDGTASPWLCDYPLSSCRRCGASIAWLTTTGGKKIPLDPGWVRRGEGEGLVLYVPSTDEPGVALVSAGTHERKGGYSCHIATCPGARGNEEAEP